MTAAYLVLRVCERLSMPLGEFWGLDADERNDLMDFERVRQAEERRRDESIIEALAAVIGGGKRG